MRSGREGRIGVGVGVGGFPTPTVLGDQRGSENRVPGIKQFRCGIPMALVFIVVYLAVTTRASTGAAPHAEEDRKVMVDMAEKILLLNEDLNIARRRSEELELEGKKVEKDLGRVREETESLRTRSLADQEKIIKDEGEVRLLMAELIRAKVKNEANLIRGIEIKDRSLRGKQGGRMVESEHLRTKLLEVQDSVRDRDHAELIEQFGEGPHRVRVKVELDTISASGDAVVFPKVNGVFVIEMAPIDLMPHSVRFFMEQVRHKLWDGTSFSYNPSHIILTRAATPDGNTSPLEDFKERDLHSISFQEYSDMYPHLPYTVGLAGLPGGPGWYINKKYNVKSHGPGGQSNFRKEYWGEAEPCFGTVVEGRDVVDRMGKMEVDGAGHLIGKIKIVSATLV